MVYIAKACCSQDLITHNSLLILMLATKSGNSPPVRHTRLIVFMPVAFDSLSMNVLCASLAKVKA